MSQVVFFNHGEKFLARLLVSLSSLREHYSGEVVIADSDGGLDRRVQQIADQFGVRIVDVPVPNLRRNSCYVAKSTLWRHVPAGPTLLVDADTLFTKSPRPLLDQLAERPDLPLFTQFSDWTTQTRKIRGRIERWAEFAPQEVAAALHLGKRPAINTGVVGWNDGCEAWLKAWAKLTREGASLPMTDELAAQVLIEGFPCQIVGQEWNASPIYSTAEPKDVGIWHFHGDKHLSRGGDGGKGHQGEAIWLPRWKKLWDANVANVRQWAPAGDRHLADWMARNPASQRVAETGGKEAG